jgi:hypothetical protein
LKAEIYKRSPDLAEMANTEATKQYLIECAIQTWDLLRVEILNWVIDTIEHRVAAV